MGTVNNVLRRLHPVRDVGVFAITQWLGNAVMFAVMVLLARRLGAAAFGALAFTQAIVQVAVLVIEFGYPLGGGQRVAQLRRDKRALSDLFSVILSGQLFLALLIIAAVGLVWGGSVYLGGPVLDQVWLLVVGCTAMLGAALQPTWLLLGLERLRTLGSIQLGAKVASLLLVLLLVDGPEDVALAVFSLGATALFAGGTILFLSLRSGWVEWRPRTLTMVRQELRGAFVVFAPGAVSSTYTALPAVVLGLISPQAAVAYFVLADRIKNVVTMVVQPLSTALIPRASVLFAEGHEAARALVRRSVQLHMLVSGVLCSLLYGAAEGLIWLAAGDAFSDAAVVLRWLAFVPMLVSMSTVASCHVLLPKRKAKVIYRVVLFVSLAGVGWLWPFVDRGGAVAAAQFVLFSEAAVCLLMWFFARRELRSLA